MADGAAASGLRDDRNVCQLCGALENLSLCGGCRDTWYCCKDHQRAHWKQHKQKCKGKQPKPKEAGLPSADGNGSCRESDKTQLTASSTVTSKLFYQAESAVPDPGTAYTVNNSSGTTGACVRNDNAFSNSTLTLTADFPSSFSAEAFLQTPAPRSSKTSPKRSGTSVASRSDFAAAGQLPVIAEEGTSERFFLEAGQLSQPFLSPRRTAIAIRHARGMAPLNVQTPVPTGNNAYLEVLNSRFATIAAYVVECLTTYGICVLDGFLGDVTGQEVLLEVKQLRERGLMKKGQVVNSGSTAENIRGDIITWVDGRRQSVNTENINYLVSCMDVVTQNCSALMHQYRINERTKAMVACYPGNETGYVRHVDNPSNDGRCITCIYYLNKDWDCRVHGGMLRIFPEGTDRVANIAPTFDRILFFWSDRRNPHEVMPARRERFAITVWYYEAEERARALKRFRGEPTNPKKQAVPLFNGAGDTGR